jgi:hypothetical protein
MKKFSYYLILSLLVVFGACETNDLEPQDPDSGIQDLQSLSIPDGFDFSTERTVSVTINDETPNVHYDIFGYRSSVGNEAENIAAALNNVLYSGKPTAGSINQLISLSNQYDKVYISRRDGLEYTFEIRDIDNNIINFRSPLEVKSKVKPSGNVGSRTSNCGDCTQTWTNGDFEDNVGSVPAVPGATFIQTDEANVDGWFTTSSDNLIEVWKSGFLGRTAQSGDSFAEINGTENAALYQRICTTPNAELTWSIWHRGRVSAGPDVAVVKIGNSLLTATTITTMSTSRAAWVNYSGTYTVPAGQQDTFLIFEAVSTGSGDTSIGNFIDNIVVTETAPGDPCGGGTINYPGGLEPAFMAFEDLWPSQGDYDFNDLVIRYRVLQNLNLDGLITDMQYIYQVNNIGASYNNGFAIELGGIPASGISSVTGQRDGNSGATSGNNGAVIRFFNDADLYLGLPTTLTINFDPPLVVGAGAGQLGAPPYNPFLIENGNANYEVHLPDGPYTRPTQPTTLPSFFPVTFYPGSANDDVNGDYRVQAGVTLDIPPVTDMANMPWAINITGTYVAPLPGVFVMKGHLKFQSWAQSGGTVDTDWFLNLPGHRDNAFLEN